MKTLYFHLSSFPFFKFQMTVVKFRTFLGNSTTLQIFLILHIFSNETEALWNFFEICTEMYFVSLFFLKERNFTTSLLTIHLKCTVVLYANLNSSSINKPFLNYGQLNMLFRFFRFLIYVYFNEALVKKFTKFQDVVHYRILGCQTLWYKNGDTLNIKQKLNKMASFL